MQWHGGKGSIPKKRQISGKQYSDNWDAIFGKKEKTPGGEDLCTCGNYVSYGSTIHNRKSVATMPMDACINCYYKVNPVVYVAGQLQLLEQHIDERIEQMKADDIEKS